MRSESRGIVVTKAELAALLEFAESSKDSSLSVVQFWVDGDRCRAYATDGKRAVEADGESNGRTEGEWTVHREFLDSVRKLLTGAQQAVLEVSAASLHSVKIEDAETGTEVSSLTWPTDAASTQTTIPTLRQIIQLPLPKRDVSRCATLPACQLAGLSLVGKAAQWDACDIYPPESAQDPLVFRIDGGAGTMWTGIVMQMREKVADVEFDQDLEAAE